MAASWQSAMMAGTMEAGRLPQRQEVVMAPRRRQRWVGEGGVRG